MQLWTRAGLDSDKSLDAGCSLTIGGEISGCVRPLVQESPGVAGGCDAIHPPGQMRRPLGTLTAKLVSGQARREGRSDESPATVQSGIPSWAVLSSETDARCRCGCDCMTGSPRGIQHRQGSRGKEVSAEPAARPHPPTQEFQEKVCHTRWGISIHVVKDLVSRRRNVTMPDPNAVVLCFV